MALRFMDGADYYNTNALMLTKWTSASSGVTIGSGEGRHGANAIKCNNLNQVFAKTLSDKASWVVGIAYKTSTLASAADIFSFFDGATKQVNLVLNTDGTLEVKRAGTAVTSGKSTASILTNTWYYIEMKVTIADSIGANTCKVRLNETDIITVATGQDLKVSANATANMIQFGGAGGNLALTYHFDDIYILDGDAGASDFLGDMRVEALFPNGNGNDSDFVNSAATSVNNYTYVDDANSDADSTYVESSTANDVDNYTFTDLSSTPVTISGIQFNIMARKTDAGTRTLAGIARISVTDYPGNSYNLSDSYAQVVDVMEESPATMNPWTASEINNSEFGIKLVA